MGKYFFTALVFFSFEPVVCLHTLQKMMLCLSDHSCILFDSIVHTDKANKTQTTDSYKLYQTFHPFYFLLGRPAKLLQPPFFSTSTSDSVLRQESNIIEHWYPGWIMTFIIEDGQWWNRGGGFRSIVHKRKTCWFVLENNLGMSGPTI